MTLEDFLITLRIHPSSPEDNDSIETGYPTLQHNARLWEVYRRKQNTPTLSSCVEAVSLTTGARLKSFISSVACSPHGSIWVDALQPSLCRVLVSFLAS